jgi:copper homeostasis protein
MVRPDGGGFVYSPFQLDQMLASITWLRENALAGALVFGALTAEGEVDCVACRRLIEAARGLPCVFHRAFEQLRDHRQGLADLIDCGFQRLLCGLSLPQLVALKSLAGERLTIMPGGGIRSHNVGGYLAAGFTEIHSSARLHDPCVPDESELARLIACLRSVSCSSI